MAFIITFLRFFLLFKLCFLVKCQPNNHKIVLYKNSLDSTCYIKVLNENVLIPQNAHSQNEAKVKLSIDQDWKLGGLDYVQFCKGHPTYLIQTVQNLEPENTLNVNRRKRSSKHYFVGRVRGQTQSQYLNYGNSNSTGKAEAESTVGGSKAVVVGNNGMGQAQSQSSPVGCEGCYGQEVGSSEELESGRGTGPGYIEPYFTKPGERLPSARPYQPGETEQRPGAQFRPGATIPGTPGYSPGAIRRPGEVERQPGAQFGEPGATIPGLPGTPGYRPGSLGERRPGAQFNEPGGIPGLTGTPGYRPGGEGEGQPGAQFGRPGATIPGLAGTPGYRPGEIRPPGEDGGRPSHEFGEPGVTIPGVGTPGYRPGGIHPPGEGGGRPGFQFEEPGTTIPGLAGTPSYRPGEIRPTGEGGGRPSAQFGEPGATIPGHAGTPGYRPGAIYSPGTGAPGLYGTPSYGPGGIAIPGAGPGQRDHYPGQSVGGQRPSPGAPSPYQPSGVPGQISGPGTQISRGDQPSGQYPYQPGYQIETGPSQRPGSESEYAPGQYPYLPSGQVSRPTEKIPRPGTTGQYAPGQYPYQPGTGETPLWQRPGEGRFPSGQYPYQPGQDGTGAKQPGSVYAQGKDQFGRPSSGQDEGGRKPDAGDGHYGTQETFYPGTTHERGPIGPPVYGQQPGYQTGDRGGVPTGFPQLGYPQGRYPGQEKQPASYPSGGKVPGLPITPGLGEQKGKFGGQFGGNYDSTYGQKGKFYGTFSGLYEPVPYGTPGGLGSTLGEGVPGYHPGSVTGVEGQFGDSYGQPSRPEVPTKYESRYPEVYGPGGQAGGQRYPLRPGGYIPGGSSGVSKPGEVLTGYEGYPTGPTGSLGYPGTRPGAGGTYPGAAAVPGYIPEKQPGQSIPGYGQYEPGTIGGVGLRPGQVGYPGARPTDEYGRPGPSYQPGRPSTVESGTVGIRPGQVSKPEGVGYKPEGGYYRPGEQTHTPGTGEVYTPGQGTGGTYIPGQGTGGTLIPGQITGGTYIPGQGTGGTHIPGQGTGGTHIPGQGTGGTYIPSQGTGGTYTPGPGTGGTYIPGQGTGGTLIPGQGTGGTLIPGQGTGGTFIPGQGTGAIYIPGQGTGVTYIPGQGTPEIETGTGVYRPEQGTYPGQTGVYGPGQYPGVTAYQPGARPGTVLIPGQTGGTGVYRPGQDVYQPSARPGAPLIPGQTASTGGSFESYKPGQSTYPGQTTYPGQPGSVIPGAPLTPGQTAGTGDGFYRPGESVYQPGGIGPSQEVGGRPGTYQPGQGAQPGGVPGQQEPITTGISRPGQEGGYAPGSGYTAVSGEGPGIGPQAQIKPGLPPSDDEESQAQTSIQQVNNETQASASAHGKYEGGTAQSQVSGTYSGTGSFSASAGSDDGKRGAMTQVAGGKLGALSSAQGRGGSGQSQTQLQLSSETGQTMSNAQTSGTQYDSQSQVQANSKGGMADAQANGPGSTSSQAQIGFVPHDPNEQDNQTIPFGGGGSASAQTNKLGGQSQAQLQGKFRYGNRYMGAAQSNTGTRESIASARNRSKIFETIRQFSGGKPEPLTANLLLATDAPSTQQAAVTESSQTVTREVSLPKQTTIYDLTITTQKPGAVGVINTAATDDNDIYEDYTSEEDEDNTKTRSIIRQTSKNQEQHIVLDPLQDLDAIVQQNYGDLPQPQANYEGTVLQPGEIIPGSNNQRIPQGFRGVLRSVAGGQKTYATGRNSQAQTISLAPGKGRIIYESPYYSVSTNTLLRNGQYAYGSGYTYQPRTPINYNLQNSRSAPQFRSLSKSESGLTDDTTGKKTPKYYTQSSSCGVFTTTCVYVNGEKVCSPSPKKSKNGTPLGC